MFRIQNSFKNINRHGSYYQLIAEKLQKSFSRVTYLPIEDTRCFLFNLLRKEKIDKQDCQTMAEVLIEADKRGVYPHGVFSLPKYLEAIEYDLVNIKTHPQIIFETPAVAMVCGANCLGPVVGHFCMELAIKKAKDVGASCVCANMSNYFGMASYYSLMARRQCLMGLTLSNTPPCMVLKEGLCASIGANPIAFSVDGSYNDSFTLDIASTKYSRERIEWMGELIRDLPPKVALETPQRYAKCPGKALGINKLLPFSDCGVGIACMIEILTGVLSGANYTKKFLETPDSQPTNIGHMFVVIDPSRFSCHFDNCLADFLFNMRTTCPFCTYEPVRIPGDVSESKSFNSETRGIPYNDIQIELLKKMSTDYNVKDLNSFIC